MCHWQCVDVICMVSNTQTTFTSIRAPWGSSVVVQAHSIHNPIYRLHIPWSQNSPGKMRGGALSNSQLRKGLN